MPAPGTLPRQADQSPQSWPSWLVVLAIEALMRFGFASGCALGPERPYGGSDESVTRKTVKKGRGLAGRPALTEHARSRESLRLNAQPMPSSFPR